MYIQWIAFKNITTGQEIERIEFNKTNLLVGVSGAGKTQILKTISDLFNFVRMGENEFNAEFDFAMGFRLIENTQPSDAEEYMWSIKFRKNKEGIPSVSNMVVMEESLVSTEKSFFNRTAAGLTIDTYTTIPKIDAKKSVITVFNGDDIFIDFYINFHQLSSYYQQELALKALSTDFFEEMHESLIENSSKARKYFIYTMEMPITGKLLLGKKFRLQAYKNVVASFKEIFPAIIDIKVDLSPNAQEYEIYIKTETSQWIRQRNISAGMLKVLLILVLVEFSLKGQSVILIDEFENALGANCLDAITEYLMESDAQLMITSHHPYIINKIPTDCWKLISQKDGKIRNQNAAEAGIGISRQDSFFQLLNRWEFRGEV